MDWEIVIKFLVFLVLYSPYIQVQTKEKSVSQKTDTNKATKNILPIMTMGPAVLPSNNGQKNLPSSSSSDFTLTNSPNGRSKQVPDSRTSTRFIRHNYCDPNQDNVDCQDLDGDCIECNFNKVQYTCEYGKNVTVFCNATEEVVCKGKRQFQKEIICQYCYQTPLWQQNCNGASMCNSLGAPRQYYRANCTVAANVLCLGNRRFPRMMPCSWKNGYKWSTTLLLSVTLGGFGADRFYLGRWQEGIGKLFSFGGLGLWTFVDIILIAVRFLGPADGSLYVD